MNRHKFLKRGIALGATLAAATFRAKTDEVGSAMTPLQDLMEE
jgi:hypothetical protein